MHGTAQFGSAHDGMDCPLSRHAAQGKAGCLVICRVGPAIGEAMYHIEGFEQSKEYWHVTEDILLLNLDSPHHRSFFYGSRAGVSVLGAHVIGLRTPSRFPSVPIANPVPETTSTSLRG